MQVGIRFLSGLQNLAIKVRAARAQAPCTAAWCTVLAGESQGWRDDITIGKSLNLTQRDSTATDHVCRACLAACPNCHAWTDTQPNTKQELQLKRQACLKASRRRSRQLLSSKSAPISSLKRLHDLHRAICTRQCFLQRRSSQAGEQGLLPESMNDVLGRASHPAHCKACMVGLSCDVIITGVLRQGAGSEKWRAKQHMRG